MIDVAINAGVRNFQRLVEELALLDRNVDPVHSAINVLQQHIERGSVQQYPQVEPRLRAIQSALAEDFSSIVDWIARSPTSTAATGEVLTPDLADFIVALSDGMSRTKDFIVLGDRTCQISARLFDQKSARIQQLVLGSAGIPSLFARMADHFDIGRWSASGVTWREFPEMNSQRQQAVMIAVLPVISDIQAHFPEAKQKTSLPYVVADELTFLVENFAKEVLAINVLVPNSYLYGAGSIENSRKRLLSTGMLQSIVQLPPNVTPRVQHSYSMLTFCREAKGNREVFTASFDTKGQLGAEAEKLGSWFSQADIDAITDSKMVESQNFKAINTSLRLVEERSTWFAEKILESGQEIARQLQHRVAELREITELLRPTGFKPQEAATWEISAKNLTRARPEVIPTKIEHSEDGTKRPGIRKLYQLAKNDIVVVTKGSVGLVGVVTDEAYANQAVQIAETCSVLRCNDAIASSALYFFLVSPAGQAALNAQITGSTSKQLRHTDLMQIKIPLPLKESRDLSDEAFEELLKIEAEFRALEERQTACFVRGAAVSSVL